MVIDFNKPIRNISEPTRDVKILFHDEHSVFVEICSNVLPKMECRFIYPLEKFNYYFENVQEAHNKIKAYIGIKHYENGNEVRCTMAKGELEKDRYLQIKEVEFVSGEPLQ